MRTLSSALCVFFSKAVNFTRVTTHRMRIDNVIIEESFRSGYTALILLKTMGQVVGSNDLRDDHGDALHDVTLRNVDGSLVLTAVHVTSIVKSERILFL